MTAVVTSNEVIAWVCIAASVIGVILLIVDAIREKQRAGEPTPEPAPADDEVDPDADSVDATYQTFDADYPEEQLPDEVAEPTDPATEADKPSTG